MQSMLSYLENYSAFTLAVELYLWFPLLSSRGKYIDILLIISVLSQHTHTEKV